MHLTTLPKLPNSLYGLICEHNNIENLPELPASIHILRCRNNLLATLPELPMRLEELQCQDNSLIMLPELPDNLINLSCQNNHLLSLPYLPNKLANLECEDNKLASLPHLPNSLVKLYCSSNRLSSLPRFPTELTDARCETNNWNAHFERFILAAREKYFNMWHANPTKYKTITELYRNAIKDYYKERSKIKKSAKKLLWIEKTLSKNTCLNNDVISNICSFISGTDGAVTTQLEAIRVTLL
jgi:hypothetical protein